MTDQDWDKPPHRPTTPFHPGSAPPPGSMEVEQDWAAKKSAYNNAQLRELGAQGTEQRRQQLDVAGKQPVSPDLSPDQQPAADDRQAAEIEQAQRAERIKAEYGVRLAGEFHQRGIADGALIGGAVDAFARSAAGQGLEPDAVATMEPAAYEQALAAASSEAERARQAAIDEQHGQFKDTAREVTDHEIPPSPSGPAGGAGMPGPSPDRDPPEGGPAVGQHPPGHDPEIPGSGAADEQPIQEARLARLYGLIEPEQPTSPDAQAGASAATRSAEDDFRNAGGEMTDHRVERFSRMVAGTDQGHADMHGQSVEAATRSPSSREIG